MANVKPLKVDSSGKFSRINHDDSVDVVAVKPSTALDGVGKDITISAGDGEFVAGNLYLNAGAATGEGAFPGFVYLGNENTSGVFCGVGISAPTVSAQEGFSEAATLYPSVLMTPIAGFSIQNTSQSSIISITTTSITFHRNTVIDTSRMLSTTGSGNINIPNRASARFQIEGTAVAGTVTADNLSILTGTNVNPIGSAYPNASTMHHHTETAIFATTGESLVAGIGPVGIENSGGLPRVFYASANASGNRKFVIGFPRSNFGTDTLSDIHVAGEVTLLDSRWDVVPTVSDIGALVYLSANAGKITLTAPTTSGHYVQKVGIITNAGGAVNTSKVLIQIGPSTLIP